MMNIIQNIMNMYKTDPIKFFMMIAIVYLLLKQSNVIENLRPSKVQGEVNLQALSTVSQLAQKWNNAVEIDNTGNVTFKKNASFNGKVGIGVSNPSAKLEVKNTTGNCLNLIGAGTGRAQLGFFDDDDAYKGGVQAGKGGALAFTTGTGTPLTISSATDTTTFNGNVNATGKITANGDMKTKKRLYIGDNWNWGQADDGSLGIFNKHRNDNKTSNIYFYGNKTVPAFGGHFHDCTWAGGDYICAKKTN